jgi:signal peptidase
MPTRFKAALRAVARTVLIAWCSAVFWALAPLVAGMGSHVILSGSMAPKLRPGDVLVTKVVDVDRLSPGMIVSFPDPVNAKRNIIHRVARLDSGTMLRTRGDANQGEDSTPVSTGSVTGVGIIRIPFVGLPAYWTRTSQYLALSVTAGLLFLTVAIAVGGTNASSGSNRHGRSGRSGGTAHRHMVPLTSPRSRNRRRGGGRRASKSWVMRSVAARPGRFFGAVVRARQAIRCRLVDLIQRPTVASGISRPSRSQGGEDQG